MIESLVTIMLAAIVLSATVGSFVVLSRISSDDRLRVMAQLQAQSVVEMMTPEFRMIGNGVPFHQANFLIAQASLTDNTVTQPILVNGSTSTQIQFRLNESGETYILTADYDPAAGNTVTLTSVDKVVIGDQIYITNSTVADDDGLWATVSAINTGANTLTFAAGAQYAPSAIFRQGSLLEVVPTITYTSATPYAGITRDDGFGPQIIVQNGQFTLTYLDSSGSAITLPLVASSADPFPPSAIQNVHSIRIGVQVRSTNRLSNGEYYIATATQSVGIRNLNYKY